MIVILIHVFALTLTIGISGLVGAVLVIRRPEDIWDERDTWK